MIYYYWKNPELLKIHFKINFNNFENHIITLMYFDLQQLLSTRVEKRETDKERNHRQPLKTSGLECD